MTTRIFPDYATLARKTADLIGDYINQKPDATICLASGSTPVQVFRYLVEHVTNKRVDLSHAHFVGLDEWVGIPANDPGSCRNMMDRDLFWPIGIDEKHIHFFDGMSSTPQAECDRINDFISKKGGLDIMLVGVGLNGHIAMNEPGSLEQYAHISQLSDETIEVGQKYFTKKTALSKGLTLGLRNFREAKVPILMANGKHKAAIIKKTIQAVPSSEIPSTIVQTIDGAMVWVDAEAGAEI